MLSALLAKSLENETYRGNRIYSDILVAENVYWQEVGLGVMKQGWLEFEKKKNLRFITWHCDLLIVFNSATVC